MSNVAKTHRGQLHDKDFQCTLTMHVILSMIKPGWIQKIQKEGAEIISARAQLTPFHMKSIYITRKTVEYTLFKQTACNACIRVTLRNV